MRIGINASFLRKPGTGIGQVTLNFLETLRESPVHLPGRGAEFFVYTEEVFAGEGFSNNFHFRSFLPAFWKRDDLIRKMLWDGLVARKAKKDGCDVFLSLYQSGTVTSRGMKHAMVVHDVIPRIFPEYRGNGRQKLYWKMIERGIRRADQVVAVSEATKNDLLHFNMVRGEVLVASLDTAPCFRHEPTAEESTRVMERYGLTPGYIYHGGGLEVRKNTEGLLRAYKFLAEKETMGATMTLPPLVISGKIFPENNPLATPVRSLVRELGLEERVRLLDFVPERDLPALYKNALFFAYPSLYEGFGLPVLEALRMGAPVLSSNRSSLPEVAGDAALLVDPDPAALTLGMEQMIKDASLRERLRAAAPRSVERFQWKHFVRTILEIFPKK